MNDITRGIKYGISVIIKSRIHVRDELVSFIKFCNVDEDEEEAASLSLFLMAFWEDNISFVFPVDLIVNGRDDRRTIFLLYDDDDK